MYGYTESTNGVASDGGLFATLHQMFLHVPLQCTWQNVTEYLFSIHSALVVTCLKIYLVARNEQYVLGLHYPWVWQMAIVIELDTSTHARFITSTPVLVL